MDFVVPKRIVLSRKGFDKKAGGFASPIFDDGRFASLPIPENDRYPSATLRFSDLGDPAVKSLHIPSIIGRLPQDFDVSSRVHLDPDIRPALRPSNQADLHGYFGQEDRAMTELQKHGACDPQNETLFLFYGWFKGVRENHDGELAWDTGRQGELQSHHQHLIWGWLQIDGEPRAIPKGSIAEDFFKIKYHPHIEAREHRRNNWIFVSRETLSFVENVSGSGVFARYDPALRLTRRSEINKRSSWVLPSFFRPSARGRIAKGRWEADGAEERVEYSGFGQEFIFDTSGHEAAALKWLTSIFERPI
jgi:hypothetical protein